MPLSPSATHALLAQLGHRPRRDLGQNFLIDGNIVRKSLAFAEVRPGDSVVEIGPGLGTLTAALLEAGAEVWAIERDRTLLAHLTTSVAPRFPDTLHLLEGDAVEHPLAGFERDRPRIVQPGEWTFKIVANLPYAIATPWLDAILSGPLPERMVLMLQREAAQRYSARPGSKAFGAISVFLQAAYALAASHRVPASCFHPRPDVESLLLDFRRLPSPRLFPQRSRETIRTIFRQRRKQIGSLARNACPGPAAAWMEQLAAAGHSPQTRPESIPVEMWVQLASLLEYAT